MIRKTHSLSLVFLLACSSSEAPPQGSQPGSSPETTPDAGNTVVQKCEAIESTRSLPAPTYRSNYGTPPPDLFADDLILLSRYEADKSLRLSILSPGASEDKELARVPNVEGFAFSATPIVLGNKHCAAYGVPSGNLTLACDDGSVEDSKIDRVSGTQLLPLLSSDGTLTLFYGSGSSSYDTITRTAGGVWQKNEKYESSVSYAGSAFLLDDKASSCFVGTGGTVNLDIAGNKIALPVKGSSCVALPTADSLHLIAGDSYGKLSLAAVRSGMRTLSFEATKLDESLSRPRAYALIQNEPHAIVDGARLLAIPLTGKGSIDLGSGGFDTVRVDGSAVRGVRVQSGADGQEVRFARRCATP